MSASERYAYRFEINNYIIIILPRCTRTLFYYLFIYLINYLFIYVFIHLHILYVCMYVAICF